MRHDQALAYVTCGLWPFSFIVSVLEGLSAGVFFISLEFVLGRVRPAWMNRIIRAFSKLDKHGELSTSSQKKLGKTMLLTSFAPLKHFTWHQIRSLFSASHPRHVVSLSDYNIATRIRVLANDLNLKPTIFHSKSVDSVAEILRSAVFEDGTKAAPVFGEMFRSLASVPLWVVVPFFFAIDMTSLYILLSNLSMFAGFSMRRRNRTVGIIAACAMLIVLGRAAFSVWSVAVVYHPSIAVLLIPTTILSLAIAALVGMRLFDNSNVVLREEKRSVIRFPLILWAIVLFVTIVSVSLFSRQLLNVAADAMLLETDLKNAKIVAFKWTAFMIVIPLTLQIAVTIYAVRLVKSRISSIRV